MRRRTAKLLYSGSLVAGLLLVSIFHFLDMPLLMIFSVIGTFVGMLVSVHHLRCPYCGRTPRKHHIFDPYCSNCGKLLED